MMYLYLDTSALVKRYIGENGSSEVKKAILDASVVGISIVGKVEMMSALTRATQYGIPQDISSAALNSFEEDYQSLIFLKLHDLTINTACQLAKDHKLSGYDAIHLATALNWMDQMNESVHFYTYDHQLWRAARSTPLLTYPEVI